MAEDVGAPLAGVRGLEVAMGLSVVGAGMATSLPGALMRDFGAEVTRVQTEDAFSLDEGVEFARSWDRGKEILQVDAHGGASTVGALAREADVIFVSGSEELVEHQGLGYRDLTRDNPRLVYVRIRPGYNSWGTMPDVELLVQARTGLLTQLLGHRRGPVFPSLNVASIGAALTATVGALARLYEREATGFGGWAETSLYDGMLAILPMVVGRVEHWSPATASHWQKLGPAVGLAFRCGDGEDIQLWFGRTGAYEEFLEAFGDTPSEAGYRADTLSGAIGERSKGWANKFATRDRAVWLEDLAGRLFRVEPVWRPGEALRDPHAKEIGLSIEHRDPKRGRISVLGPVGRVTPVPGVVRPAAGTVAPLLTGLRVLDLSAFLAGPVTPHVLAELGAEVIKVEPATGDIHRDVEAMFAAGQRGKRAVALDLKSPDAPTVLHRLFRWCDVVHHNSRVGLAERLGYDEASVRAVNPDVVYCHASGFGPRGPRALLAANDHLMQGLTGVEAAAGGDGNPPTFIPWGSVDVTGGWIAAAAVIVGLYARRRTGTPQSVSTSLMGAGMMLKAGPIVTGETLVEGPVLDREQTGYGAAYRIYQAADGTWIALAVLDQQAWDRLREMVAVDNLPAQPPALRAQRGEGPQPAEKLLADAFATRGAEAWVAELTAVGVPVELVVEEDRAAFIDRIFDDPVNRQLGRVVGFQWGPRGFTEQAALPLRFGPEPRPEAPRLIPALGEHTDEVLGELGLDTQTVAGLRASGTVAGG